MDFNYYSTVDDECSRELVLQNLVQKESLGQKRRVAQEKMNQTAAAAFFSLGLTLAQGQEPARDDVGRFLKDSNKELILQDLQ